ncbi:MAG: VWA domain-containing protein [Myxococcota bacterium]
MASRGLLPLIWVALNVYACTDAELCVMPCMDPPPPVEDNVVHVEGDACTVEPASVTFPYKILFIIDVSGSNATSDPLDRRADAVQRVIEEYGNNPSISFGIVRFHSEAERVTPTFMSDVATLVATGIPPLRDDLDATNYIEALREGVQFLEDDMRSITASELARTRYDVQFLSDGEPNPCIPIESVQAATESLMRLAATWHPFQLKLSTTRLTYEGFVSGCQYGDPSAFLEPMADIGGGTFQELQDDQLDFDITFTEIKRRFESRDFYLVNLSRVVWNDQLWPDSDLDGIRDAADPNPTEADVDRDGCSDRVDLELMPNDGLCRSQCLEIGSGDRDGDGLLDCAEASLGYDPSSSDSDGDGFPDDLELHVGTNPLDARTLTQDTDRDGTNDAQEIRTGTNPIYPEAGDAWSYGYSSLAPSTPRSAATPGTSCFAFEVENVRLVETLATSTTIAGDNVVCLYSLQTVIDAPDGAGTVTRTCTVVNYRKTIDGEQKRPADGSVSISPEDFAIAYR